MINLIHSQSYDKTKAVSSLEFCGITYTNVRENWIHRERFLTTDEMIYLRKGELYLLVNDRKFTIHKNNFFFIHRFSIISGFRSSDMPCEFYTVSYNGIIPAEMESREIPMHGNSIYTDEILKRMYDAEHDRTDANECNILFLSLFYEVERFLFATGDSLPLMEQTLNYINDNINNPITVDTVCDHLGYNRDYISKQFLACYGITIKKYIDQQKINVAKNLLISSRMSLEKIALAIGFENAQQFYKFFSYHEKISPSRFRKMNS